METNSFFWYQFQSYATWFFTSFFALWIGIEIYFASRFFAGLKDWFFFLLYGLCFLFFVLNFGSSSFGLWGLANESHQFAARPPQWFGTLVRIYSPMMFFLTAAVLLRRFNYKTKRATPEGRGHIIKAFEVISKSDSAVKASQVVNESAEKLIHKAPA